MKKENKYKRKLFDELRHGIEDINALRESLPKWLEINMAGDNNWNTYRKWLKLKSTLRTHNKGRENATKETK